jgi:uncharacterized protein (TIGR02266 family)
MSENPLSLPSVVPADGRADVEQLERDLKRANAELATLRTERDLLQTRLQEALDDVSALKKQCELVPTELEISPSAALLPDSPASVEPAAAAEGVGSVIGLEPRGPFASEMPAPSLSRLIVSTCPPEDRSDDGNFAAQAALSERSGAADRPSSAERRRRERLGCEFEVEFLDDTHLIAGLTQDISEGGVFVATYQTLAVGTKVALELELPGGRVEVRGEVRWTRPESEELDQRPGFGVAFTVLSPEAFSALTQFCRSIPARYYEI